jgi:kynurenine formamidase
VNTWGRWGESDQRGALNLLGAEQVRRGLSAVRSGEVVSLAAPIHSGRGFGVVGRSAPQHYMVRDGGDYAAGLTERAGFGFADDVITLPTHGVSHLDALAHVWRDGVMYNGHAADSVSSRGAARLGIENVQPIVTRGIFVDAAPGGCRQSDDAVHVDELIALIDNAGAQVQSGDALLVRTGWLEAQRRGVADAHTWPGLDRDCGAWLAEREVVLVGADNIGVESYPSSDPDCQVPLHIELVRGHGIYFAELLDLGGLAESGHSTFLFVLSVLPVVGAVGSPVSPVAIL